MCRVNPPKYHGLITGRNKEARKRPKSTMGYFIGTDGSEYLTLGAGRYLSILPQDKASDLTSGMRTHNAIGKLRVYGRGLATRNAAYLNARSLEDVKVNERELHDAKATPVQATVKPSICSDTYFLTKIVYSKTK
jgi:hypothetical protein